MGAIWISLVVALNAVAATEAGGSGVPRSPLPINVTIDASLRAVVEEWAALSPTLGRQFAAIAAAPAKVEIRVTLAPLPAFRRAEAVIRRFEAGFLHAQLQVPPGADFVELLAHELEHVLEQIERVDLERLSRTDAAVRDLSGMYETVRARDAGRAAAFEVEQALRASNGLRH